MCGLRQNLVESLPGQIINRGHPASNDCHCDGQHDQKSETEAGKCLAKHKFAWALSFHLCFFDGRLVNVVDVTLTALGSAAGLKNKSFRVNEWKRWRSKWIRDNPNATPEEQGAMERKFETEIGKIVGGL